MLCKKSDTTDKGKPYAFKLTYTVLIICSLIEVIRQQLYWLKKAKQLLLLF